MMLYSGGRNANSQNLACEEVGIATGIYERIIVDKQYRTTARPSKVYAIGDVTGPPGLASSAQQQGRALVDRLFHPDSAYVEDDAEDTGSKKEEDAEEEDEAHNDVSEVDSFFVNEDLPPETLPSKNLFGSISGSADAVDAPLTLWTIPEIASVGLSIEEAKARGMENVIEGRAYFKDMARGRLAGGEGFLKVVSRYEGSSADSNVKGAHTIIGVHIIGEGANELIQMGSILVHGKATLEQVSRTPFAAVTLSGLYQMACDNALFSPEMRQQQDSK